MERIDEAHNSGAGGVIAPAWRHRATPISGSTTEEGAKECLPQEAMAGDKAETRWAPLAGHTEGATLPMKVDAETKVTVSFSAALVLTLPSVPRSSSGPTGS